MNGFKVEKIAELQLQSTPPLSEMYTLSPFVWRSDSNYGMLLRAVPHAENPAEKIARVYYGQSENGLFFQMDDQPTIPPGPDEDDRDGCEDPTCVYVDGTAYVYYTGWNETEKQGKLLLTAGKDIQHLEKRGVMLPSTDQHTNPKEPTLVLLPDGSWKMFFEYANEGASKIGVVTAPKVDGPWTMQPPLFLARQGQWDAWHLSTGPIIGADSEHPVMFYNGATEDAHWRIGWIMFNADYSCVISRSDEPMITPPPQEEGATDIAFAASCVEEGDLLYLYYSIADKDMKRATIRRA